MNKSQIKIIDCFTQLIVYTLEFKENSQSEIYTVDKLAQDYELLIKKAQEAFNFDGVGFENALFPIVAWIDEMVLSSQNKDKKLWRKQLLQKKFFNTSNAGHEFFEKLEVLPSDAFEVRLLYLYCMFLGFKGRYYKVENAKELADVFELQKDMIHDDFLESFPKLAFRDAYAQTQLPIKKKFKTSYKGLWVIIAISLTVGLVLFLASQAYLNGLLDKYNIFFKAV